MKSILLAAVGLFFSAHALADGCGVVYEYRYIGYTTHTDDGQWVYGDLGGITAMHKACEDQFGPSARAANIAEAYFRRDGGGPNAWVVPGGPMMMVRGSGNVHGPIDAATGAFVGIALSNEASAGFSAYCGQYRLDSDSRQGAAALGVGGIVAQRCDISLPAACSARVPVPKKC